MSNLEKPAKPLACIVCGPITRTVQLVNNRDGDLVIRKLGAGKNSLTVYSLGQYEEISGKSGVRWGRTFRVAHLPEHAPRHGLRPHQKGAGRKDKGKKRHHQRQAVPA